MSEWTKGYALTQPFEAVYDHVNELQEDNADLRACNAELLAACKAARAAMTMQSTLYQDTVCMELDAAIAKGEE